MLVFICSCNTCFGGKDALMKIIWKIFTSAHVQNILYKKLFSVNYYAHISTWKLCLKGKFIYLTLNFSAAMCLQFAQSDGDGE